MAEPLEYTFAAIAGEMRPDPFSDRWHSVVNTIAAALRGASAQRLSRPYRRLEAFVLENKDLLDYAYLLMRKNIHG